jgi:hypothetical protein
LKLQEEIFPFCILGSIVTLCSIPPKAKTNSTALFADDKRADLPPTNKLAWSDHSGLDFVAQSCRFNYVGQSGIFRNYGVLRTSSETAFRICFPELILLLPVWCGGKTFSNTYL